MSTLNFVMQEIYILLMQDVTAYKISTGSQLDIYYI